MHVNLPIRALYQIIPVTLLNLVSYQPTLAKMYMLPYVYMKYNNMYIYDALYRNKCIGTHHNVHAYMYACAVYIHVVTNDHVRIHSIHTTPGRVYTPRIYI